MKMVEESINRTKKMFAVQYAKIFLHRYHIYFLFPGAWIEGRYFSWCMDLKQPICLPCNCSTLHYKWWCPWWLLILKVVYSLLKSRASHWLSWTYWRTFGWEHGWSHVGYTWIVWLNRTSKLFFKCLNGIFFNCTLTQVIAFMMDNATNNDTLVRSIEMCCNIHGIPFSTQDARLWCMPHTVHLATLKASFFSAFWNIKLIYCVATWSNQCNNKGWKPEGSFTSWNVSRHCHIPIRSQTWWRSCVSRWWWSWRILIVIKKCSRWKGFETFTTASW